jgi:tetratricopeptide (TPR) repeat protein
MTFLSTTGWVVFAIAGLSVADIWLAKTERAESAAEAARLFREGQSLMRQGKNAAAAERIQDAILLERRNRQYRRSLAEAQLAAGAAGDAEGTLSDLLLSDSTDGAANLLMARALAKEKRFSEAASYFHRAIYGQWDAGQWDAEPEANRLRARFELIDLLAQHGSAEELLAELLPVQDETPRDVERRVRIGQLFLTARSPARAADVFRSVLALTPANVDANSGLGEAELAQGQYRAAQRQFETTLRLAPGNVQVRQRLELCDRATRLDPTIRGLSPAEKLQRSLKLLESISEEIKACVGENPSAQMSDLFTRADQARRDQVRRSGENERADSALELAEQLWHSGRAGCKSPGDAAVALVLARLTQQ